MIIKIRWGTFHIFSLRLLSGWRLWHAIFRESELCTLCFSWGCYDHNHSHSHSFGLWALGPPFYEPAKRCIDYHILIMVTKRKEGDCWSITLYLHLLLPPSFFCCALSVWFEVLWICRHKCDAATRGDDICDNSFVSTGLYHACTLSATAPCP